MYDALTHTLQVKDVTIVLSVACGGEAEDLGPLSDGTFPNPGDVVADLFGPLGAITVSRATLYDNPDTCVGCVSLC